MIFQSLKSKKKYFCMLRLIQRLSQDIRLSCILTSYSPQLIWYFSSDQLPIEVMIWEQSNSKDWFSKASEAFTSIGGLFHYSLILIEQYCLKILKGLSITAKFQYTKLILNSKLRTQKVSSKPQDSLASPKSNW